MEGIDNNNSDSEVEYMENTPPEIVEIALNATLNLLPQKSREKYECAYQKFMEWRKNKKIPSFSENVILAYFEEQSKSYKASTLWSQYSMLRSTLSIKNNVDISKYVKLRAFLKRQNDNYKPKKSKTLTSEEIQKFLKEAPDYKYLLTKVNKRYI